MEVENLTYRSSWAKKVDEQLKEDARRDNRKNEKIRSERVDGNLDKEKNDKLEDIERDDRTKNKRDTIPENWEEILVPEILTKKKMSTKAKKPLKILRWFGDEDTSSTDDSSSGEEEWKEVDRIEKNKQKKKMLKEKKIRKEKETAMKAKNMVGVGEINDESVDYFQMDGVSRHQARVLAIKEFLAYNLAFDDRELEELEIIETREANKEKIIYMAVKDIRHVKELYFRKADSKNDSIIIRNYIPPQFHDRFKALNQLCSARRLEDKTLKTQIRFGTKDLELWTKTKGSEEQFRKVDIGEFFGKDVHYYLNLIIRSSGMVIMTNL